MDVGWIEAGSTETSPTGRSEILTVDTWTGESHTHAARKRCCQHLHPRGVLPGPQGWTPGYQGGTSPWFHARQEHFLCLQKMLKSFPLRIPGRLGDLALSSMLPVPELSQGPLSTVDGVLWPGGKSWLGVNRVPLSNRDRILNTYLSDVKIRYHRGVTVYGRPRGCKIVAVSYRTRK